MYKAKALFLQEGRLYHLCGENIFLEEWDSCTTIVQKSCKNHDGVLYLPKWRWNLKLARKKNQIV